MRWAVVSLAIFVTCTPVTQAEAQKKIALVIGNGEYTDSTRKLGNPSRDARAVGAALEKTGFRLVRGRPLLDLDKQAMDKIAQEFGEMAQDADMALVYFAGHGLQTNGVNYLIPVDFDWSSSPKERLDFRSINANLVLRAMSGARLKMMLLDACRTPFGRGSGEGLAAMQAERASIEHGRGMVIHFATQPNAIASEGPANGNSPYAKQLATYIPVKGLELFAMLMEVGLGVMATTHSAQQPWITASPIKGPVYLSPPDAVAPIPSTPQSLLVGRAPPEIPVQRSTTVTTGASLDYVQKAYRQLDQKDYSGARATLTQGIAADGNFAPAYSYRGFAWYAEGSTKEAEGALAAYRRGLPDFDTAIRLDPSYAPVRRHRGSTILATYRTLKSLGRPTNDIVDRAIDDFKAAVTLDPGSKRNLNALGEGYLAKGSYRAAIDSFNRAIERDPSYAAPYAGLCSAYRMLGDLATAQTNARLAADRDDTLRSRACLSGAI
jgi:Tfp pilus assembly protein PilF